MFGRGLSGWTWHDLIVMRGVGMVAPGWGQCVLPAEGSEGQQWNGAAGAKALSYLSTVCKCTFQGLFRSPEYRIRFNEMASD
jgi:hypothetical protein